jgi:hypothetical protein
MDLVFNARFNTDESRGADPLPGVCTEFVRWWWLLLLLLLLFFLQGILEFLVDLLVRGPVVSVDGLACQPRRRMQHLDRTGTGPTPDRSNIQRSSRCRRQRYRLGGDWVRQNYEMALVAFLFWKK